MRTIAALSFVTAFSALAAPPAPDPVVVNAPFIQVKLDNPRVRAFESALKPGDREQRHGHPATVVYVVSGGKLRNHLDDGTVKEVEWKTGDTVYREPLIHWAENIGDTTVRVLVVELK